MQKLKLIMIDDIYVTVLKARMVKNSEGWMRMEPFDRSVPKTGSQVMDLVAQALATDGSITPRGLAEQLGVDREKLYGAIQMQTGMRAQAFFNAYRIRQACEWLRFTDLKGQEIARRCGFASPGSFTTYFIKQMKCTPSAYRKANRPANYRELYEWEGKTN